MHLLHHWKIFDDEGGEVEKEETNVCIVFFLILQLLLHFDRADYTCWKQDKESEGYMICHIENPPTDNATTPVMTASNIHCTGK